MEGNGADGGGGLTEDDDATLHMAAVSYVTERRTAREAGSYWIDALRAPGVDIAEVRAVPLTGRAGRGEVELRLSAAQLEWAVSMIARGARVACDQAQQDG